ncbi:discoidin domain-containing protein [Paenibacillus gansuensis]|uniref:Discoidin domain-containing protein n=1 Tax=Paenibacillus gansuensis TaxID=306542 RepID=A0ABW5P7R3_9BACL
MKRKRMNMYAFMLIVCMLASYLPAGAAKVAEAAVWRTYYVSPNGNDNWSGTLAAPNASSTDGPFKTIQKARDVVRTVKGSMTGDIVVQLRGGTYPVTSAIVFNESDSGAAADKRIIYKAYNGETPVLSGGQQVTGTWSLVPGKSYYKITLPNTVTDFRNFYIDGERRTRARTELPIAGKGWYNDTNTSESRDGYIVNGNMLETLTDPGKAEIHQQVSWRDNRLPIKSVVSLTNGDKALNMDQPYFNEALNNTPFDTTPSFNRVFYIENDLSLLDRQGEWYFNQSTKELYYYPKSGENLSAVQAYYPVTKTLIDVKGGSLTSKVRYLTFQGLTFKHTAWNEPSTEGMFANQAEWVLRPDGPANTSLAEHPPGAVQIDAAEYIDVKDNDFRNLGSIGLAVLYANHTNVIGNVFYDISEAGVTIGTQAGAVVDKAWEETPKFNTVQNNVLRYIGQEYMGAPAIQPYFSQDTNISYNDISEVPYCGISVNSWTPDDSVNPTRRNTISNNKVTNYMKVTRDCGGIYTWATLGDSAPENRSVIKNNFVKKGYGDYAGLYLDETSKYADVFNNAVEDPQPNWLYLWKPSIKFLNITGNYATTQTWVNQATESTIEQATLYTASSPPSAVQSIINGAGLQSGYTGLLTKVPARGTNAAPAVSAGSNSSIALTSTLQLNPAVSDDGLPLGLYVKTTWSKVSGPGTVTFGNPNVAKTTAAFSAAGTYVLRLTAKDGDLSTSSDVTVTVSSAALSNNFALNQSASSVSYYDSSYVPAKAVDGDINTGWASVYSEGVTDEYLTVDLGSPIPITRVEMVTRQDPCCYSWTGPRTNFVVMVSNDSSFSDYSTVTALGAGGSEPFEEKGTWAANSTDTAAYRYVRVAKAPYGDMFIAELRVFTTPSSDTQAPTSPGNLNSPTKTDSSVNLSWSASSDNVAVTKYNVYQDGALIGNTTQTSYTVNGLMDNTAYSFTVKAVDAAYNLSAASSPLSVTTNSIGTNLALNQPVTSSSDNETSTDKTKVNDGNTGTRWASAASDTGQWIYIDLGSSKNVSRIRLRWEAAYATGYKIEMTDNPGGSWTQIYAATSGDGGVDDLSGISGTGRYIRMTATQRVNPYWGVSLYEFEVYGSAGTGDTTAPSKPANLSSPSKTGSSVSLSWTASTDNVGVTGYDVYNGSTKVNSSLITGTSYTVSGLSAGTAYTFTVKARDAAGNESTASDALTVTTDTASSTNLALNKTVATSTNDSTSQTGTQAVDGNTGTRWASSSQDPSWIYVDLGAQYSINRVKLLWEAAYGKDYKIQVSNDAATWSDIYTKTGGTGGTEDITGLSGTGRYVRVYGTARGTTWGYSLWEFEVYGTAVTSSLLSANKTASTSTNDSTSQTGAQAVDGNMGTRWASTSQDPSWIYVDLGASKQINRVKLVWETAYGKNYKIQVSNDAATWTDIYTKTNGTGGTEDLTGLSGTGRYVRMYGTERGTTYGYSLWEFEVYGN